MHVMVGGNLTFFLYISLPTTPPETGDNGDTAVRRSTVPDRRRQSRPRRTKVRCTAPYVGEGRRHLSLVGDDDEL
jgi:hypothetical protein